MALSTGSIQDWVYESVQDVPVGLSGTHVKDLVERGLRIVQNWTGETISTTEVPTKYQSVLTNLGIAYLHSEMANTGVDFDARIGEFSVRKGGIRGNVNEKRAEWYIKQVNSELISIGRNAGNRYAKVY